MKYYIEYSHMSSLSGPVKFREEYKTKKEMFESLGSFRAAGYMIDDYGEIS